jgi:hypothetical protein
MATEPEDHPDVQVFDEIRYIEHLVRTAIARKLPVGLNYLQGAATGSRRWRSRAPCR